MSINPVVGSLPSGYINSLVYDTVKLPDMEIEIEPSGDGLLAKIPDKPMYKLTDGALENLCKYLEVPFKFAKKLREAGNNHVLAYLQQQLSKAIQEPLTYVTVQEGEENNLLSFTEKRFLPFRGQEGLDLDNAVLDFAKKEDFPMELANRQFVNGDVHYLFLHKDEVAVACDPSERGLQPLWRWGYTFGYSLFGKGPGRFGTEIQRMCCTNLTYLPDKVFGNTPSWGEDYASKLETVENFFLKDTPTADWRQLQRWVKRLANVPSSMNELKDARRKLHSVLMVDKEDKETEERIDAALQWRRVVKEYGLDDKEFKPSKTWYMRATTPLTLFDLYNTITREATAAPNTVPFDNRQGLLVYGGKMLSKIPDISENPPSVTWGMQ
jgi:hypothetical protein